MGRVYLAKDLTEAHLVRGLLEEHGLRARVEGHYLWGAVGELPPAGLLAVSVDDADRAAAERLIERYRRAAFALDDDVDVGREESPAETDTGARVDYLFWLGALLAALTVAYLAS